MSKGKDGRLFVEIELNFINEGTSNLQRSALGEIQNARHNSESSGKIFKEPLKPLSIRDPKEKENAFNRQKMESMDISNNEMDVNPMEDDPEIEDIDAEDAGNPQLVVEYVNDIYNYLRSDVCMIGVHVIIMVLLGTWRRSRV